VVHSYKLSLSGRRSADSVFHRRVEGSEVVDSERGRSGFVIGGDAVNDGDSLFVAAFGKEEPGAKRHKRVSDDEEKKGRTRKRPS
jgi:hypothetical protein